MALNSMQYSYQSREIRTLPYVFSSRDTKSHAVGHVRSSCLVPLFDVEKISSRAISSHSKLPTLICRLDIDVFISLHTT